MLPLNKGSEYEDIKQVLGRRCVSVKKGGAHNQEKDVHGGICLHLSLCPSYFFAKSIEDIFVKSDEWFVIVLNVFVLQIISFSLSGSILYQDTLHKFIFKDFQFAFMDARVYYFGMFNYNEVQHLYFSRS